MNWMSRPDDAPPTWIVDQLANHLGGIRVAVRLAAGKIIVGALDGAAQDHTSLKLEVGSRARDIPSEEIVAYAFVDDEALDRSDELRGQFI